jgi:hypothetical protein
MQQQAAAEHVHERPVPVGEVVACDSSLFPQIVEYDGGSRVAGL